jgi:mannan endo-1,4-beta-mannosidase
VYSRHRARSKVRIRAWTGLTVPALVLCCAFASGALGRLTPSSWQPITGPVYSADDSSPLVSRVFGVALAGPQLPKWAAETGIRPQLLMSFQAWCHRPSPANALAQDRAAGVKMVLITWDPWCPTKRGLADSLEGAPQPAFSNAAIVAGRWDSYIRSYADAVRASGVTVHIRYAHEMNGNWYPWQWNAKMYVRAWRHVVTIFRQQHAANARFVWSGLWVTERSLARSVRHALEYWPGRSYVDDIGTTFINFGGSRFHPVRTLEPIIAAMHKRLRMPVLLTEVNTEYTRRVAWIQNLAGYAAATPWLAGVAWCQLPSYGGAHMHTGDMNWQVATDNGGSKAALRAVAAALNKPGRSVARRASAAGA